MDGRALIEYLKLVHGGFNLFVFLLLVLQASRGLRIRRQRRAGAPPEWAVIKIHRHRGPLLVVFVLIGYAAGLTLAYVDHGKSFTYPLHFITGTAIALLLVMTYAVSGKIRGAESVWRTIHFGLGIVILCLYAAQILFGLGILL